MKYKTPETRARYLNIAIGLFLAALLILFIAGMWTDAGAEKAPPNDQQWSIYWGDTAHVLCYESPAAKEQGQPPAGILNFDVTGSDVVTITCRPPGTVKDGQ